MSVGVGEGGANLVGDGHGDDPLLERDGGVRPRDQDESAEHVAATEHRKFGAVSGEGEPTVAVVLHHRDHAAPFQPRQRVGERERFELAAAEPEQLGQLDLGGHDHVRRRVPARFADGGDTMDAPDLFRRTLAAVYRMPAIRRELPDGQPDGQQQQGRLDVVPGVDLQRQIRHRVEEVEGQRCRHGGCSTGAASTRHGGEHDHEDEDERNVGVEHVVP